VCQDSSVGISTCYGLYGLGIESGWGARFSPPVQTGLLYNGLFPVVKRPVRGVDRPLPSNSEDEGREDLAAICAFIAGYVGSKSFLPWGSLQC
jgi:hypothetical protein